MPDNSFFAASDINIETIRQIFKNSYKEFYDPEENGDEMPFIVYESAVGLKILIRVRDEPKLIIFSCTYRLKKEIPLQMKLLSANKANDSLILVRTSIDNDGDAIFDYQLLCRGRVHASQIVGISDYVPIIIDRAIRETDFIEMID